MSNAILIHGSCDKEEFFSKQYPSLSNSHWFPWLQKQLLINGIETQTPEMPEPYKPNYEKWKREFERYDINQNTILVGHSCGGGFLVRWLSENEIQVKILVLVAPWIDPSERRSKTFFDFQINPRLQSRVKNIDILISEDDDTEGVQKSFSIISKALKSANIHKFKDKGHFCLEEMETEKFPFLSDLILK